MFSSKSHDIKRRTKEVGGETNSVKLSIKSCVLEVIRKQNLKNYLSRENFSGGQDIKNVIKSAKIRKEVLESFKDGMFKVLSSNVFKK